MSRGRASRPLAELQAQAAAARPARAPRLERLPADGAMLPPHRSLRDMARTDRRNR